MYEERQTIDRISDGSKDGISDGCFDGTIHGISDGSEDGFLDSTSYRRRFKQLMVVLLGNLMSWFKKNNWITNEDSAYDTFS